MSADDEDDRERTPTVELLPRPRTAATEQPATRVPHVLMLNGPTVGELYRLNAGETIAGRSSGAAIRVYEAAVSRRHAKFLRDAQRVFIEDLGSTNGTSINGVRVDGVTEIEDGDLVMLGGVALLKVSCDPVEASVFRERLVRIAPRDRITGTFSREYVAERLKGEFAFALRHQLPFAVLLLDVDHMAAVNEQHGRAAGDEVLTHVGRVVRDELRREDVVCRWRDDDFLVLCRGVDSASAAILAQRLCLRVARAPLVVAASEILVTISVGVATAPDDGHKSPDDIVRAALAGTADAKANGRNRVAIRRRE